MGSGSSFTLALSLTSIKSVTALRPFHFLQQRLRDESRPRQAEIAPQTSLWACTLFRLWKMRERPEVNLPKELKSGYEVVLSLNAFQLPCDWGLSLGPAPRGGGLTSHSWTKKKSSKTNTQHSSRDPVLTGGPHVAYLFSCHSYVILQKQFLDLNTLISGAG